MLSGTNAEATSPLNFNELRMYSQNYVALTCLIMLSACGGVSEPVYGTYAYRSNTTNQERVDSWTQCEAAAMSQVGSNQKTQTTSIWYDSEGNRQGGETYSYDQNADLRDRMQEICMREKGFTLTEMPYCSVFPDEMWEEHRLGTVMVRPLPNSCLADLNGFAVPVQMG